MAGAVGRSNEGGIQSSKKVVKQEIDDLSERSHLDNSLRPLNPEDENEMDIGKITDTKWIKNRKDRKKSLRNSSKASRDQVIPDSVCGKFSAGHNNG